MGCWGGSPGPFVWPESWTGTTEQWVEMGESREPIHQVTQPHKGAGGRRSGTDESPGTPKSLVGNNLQKQPTPTVPVRYRNGLANRVTNGLANRG